jgi:autoinducer 2 (AI-2) kinase
MSLLLALDAGTGSCRAVFFDETGRQLSIAQREWFHRSVEGVPGSMEFDTRANWALIVECIREAGAGLASQGLAGAKVDAIAATSMREGIVVYDEGGSELWACANVDARAVGEVRSLRARGLEPRFYAASGQTFALGAAPRLLWLKEHSPAVYERAHSVAMLSDWIATRLGARVAVDRSNGGTMGLFDLATRTWSPRLVSDAGLKESFAATPVRESGEIIGEVSAKAAAETGLPVGTPIVMGGGDAQLGGIGVGAVRSGDVAIFGGTFWQQEVNFPTPPVDRTSRVRINFHAVPGQWQAETLVFFAGLAVRWMRDAIFPDVKAAAIAAGRDPYAVLEEMAEKVPVGSNGVVPVFSDAMDYSHWMHAAPGFMNLAVDPERCDRVTLYRALLENVAIVVSANIERITSMGMPWPKSAILASGASKGRLWPQIVSDALGIPIRIPVVKEATALGAAICAGVGVGVYPSFQDAMDRTVSFERVVEPRPELAPKYSELKDTWSAVYAPQLELARSGVTESMWRAPGE